jgi:hypothetical protein
MLLLAAFNSMPSDMRKHLDRLDMFDCSRTTVLVQSVVASAAVPPLSSGVSKSFTMPLAAYETSEQSESEGHNSDANPASDSEGPQQLLDMTPEEVMSMIRRQQERKERKAEKARRRRQRAMRNQQQAQLESLQAESEQFELLSEGIAMWVQKQREALQQAQEDAERAHLESEQRRAAVSVKETVRYSLFSVRCEALGAISEVTKAIHYVEGLIATMRLPRIRAGERVTATQEVTVEAPSQEAEEIFAMAHRWACELLAAVEKGITIRAFKVTITITAYCSVVPFLNSDSNIRIKITDCCFNWAVHHVCVFRRTLTSLWLSRRGFHGRFSASAVDLSPGCRHLVLMLQWMRWLLLRRCRMC